MVAENLLGIRPKDKHLSNITIGDRASFCKANFNTELRIPLVISADTLRNRPAGSLVFDLSTQTLNVSNGTQFIPLENMATLVDSVTVFANADSGSDENDGATSTIAVATIQRALDILGTFRALTGIVQLEGATPFDLGTNASLDFFPATASCGTIIIQGQRANELDDVVASVANIGPFDTWRQITGTTGGFGAGAYAKSFVRNESKDSVFVIQNNGTDTVDVIGGDSNLVLENPVAFEVGDSVTLYQVTSRITYSETIVLNNPSNSTIIFDSVDFDGSDESALVFPEIPTFTLRGSRFYSTNSESSLLGSISLLGVYVYNTTFQSRLNGFNGDQNSCVRSVSVYLEGPDHNNTDNCSSVFLLSENCFGIGVRMFSGDILLSSVMIIDAQLRAVQVGNGCTFRITSIIVSGSNPFGLLSFIRGTSGVITNIQVTATGNSSCIRTEFDGRVLLLGTIILSTEAVVFDCLSNSVISVFPTSFQMTSTSTTLPLIVTRSSVNFSVYSNGSNTLEFTQSAASSAPMIRLLGNCALNVSLSQNTCAFSGNSSEQLIFARGNSSIYFEARNAVAVFDFVNNGTGSCIDVDLGSQLNIENGSVNFNSADTALRLTRGSQTNTDITLTNAGAGMALECGGNAAGAATTQNDLAAGTPQNCFFYSD